MAEVLNSAQQLAKIAKTYRETKSVEEIGNIQSVLNALRTKMITAANTGGIYVQITPESDPAIYAAATTKSGMKWLQDPAQGFTLDIMNRVLVIYWDRRDRIQREVDGIPDEVVNAPFPSPTTGTTTPTAGTTTPTTGTTTPTTGTTTPAEAHLADTEIFKLNIGDSI